MTGKGKASGITIPGFKLHYRSIVGKTKWYWLAQTHRPMDQNEDPDNERSQSQQNDCIKLQIIYPGKEIFNRAKRKLIIGKVVPCVHRTGD